MKTPTISAKTDLNSLPWVQKLHLERLNPLLLMITGLVLLILLMLTLFLGGVSHKDNEAALEQASQTMGQVSSLVQDFRRVLEDQQVQELAAMAVANPEQFDNLRQYLSGRIPELIDARLFDPQLDGLRATELDPYGYAVLNMLLQTESGIAPLQIHGTGAQAYLAMTVKIGEADSPLAYLLVKANPSAFLSAFKASLPEPGGLVLDQYNGRFTPTMISALATPISSKEHLVWLRVPASLFRVGVVQEAQASSSMGILRPVLLVLGIILLVLGAALKLRPLQAPLVLEEDPEEIEAPDDPDPIQMMTWS